MFLFLFVIEKHDFLNINLKKTENNALCNQLFAVT